jgi:hypothetical protein
MNRGFVVGGVRNAVWLRALKKNIENSFLFFFFFFFFFKKKTKLLIFLFFFFFIIFFFFFFFFFLKKKNHFFAQKSINGFLFFDNDEGGSVSGFHLFYVFVWTVHL